jgi:hypothetical protein
MAELAVSDVKVTTTLGGDTAPAPATSVVGTKDRRSFRPDTLAEINAQANYKPLVFTYKGKEHYIGCGASLEDFGIILSLYICLWSSLVAFYALLLKGVLDTDQQSTVLMSFLFIGIIFILMVLGGVYTGQLEELRLASSRDAKAAAEKKAEPVDPLAAVE